MSIVFTRRLVEVSLRGSLQRLEEAMLTLSSAPGAIPPETQAEMQRIRVSLIEMIKAVEEPSLG